MKTLEKIVEMHRIKKNNILLSIKCLTSLKNMGKRGVELMALNGIEQLNEKHIEEKIKIKSYKFTSHYKEIYLSFFSTYLSFSS